MAEREKTWIKANQALYQGTCMFAKACVSVAKQMVLAKENRGNQWWPLQKVKCRGHSTSSPHAYLHSLEGRKWIGFLRALLGKPSDPRTHQAFLRTSASNKRCSGYV